MGRIEFPATPLYAAKAPIEHPASPYSQLTLEGTDLNQGAEIELGYCMVTEKPTYAKRKKANLWQCSVHVQPDLLHPDQEGAYDVRATGERADRAHSLHLRPGDSALMRGVVSTQETMLGNGETTIIHYFSVTSIEVIARSPRISVTAFEKQQ